MPPAITRPAVPRAFWSESYGGPGVQPLTSASGPALEAGGFLAPLGSLHIGRAGDAAAIDAFLAEFEGTTSCSNGSIRRPSSPAFAATGRSA